MKPSSTQRRVVRCALLSTALLLMGLGGQGCSECNGTEINGRCEEPCVDEECPISHRCFENVCRAPCTTSSDCPVGQQCQRVRTEYNFEGRLCTGVPEGSDGDSSGKACTDNGQCDGVGGFHCVDGSCRFTCEVHEHCGSLGSCTGSAMDASGQTVRVCEGDGFPRNDGQYGTKCPNADECDAEGRFRCVGAGPGDVDAYCTRWGCAEDTDCPTGFFCSTRRVRERACSDICGFPGSNRDDCVDDALIGGDGHYECGPTGLVENICLLREFCNECESDVDCLGKPHQICARDDSGNKICTVRCDPRLNSCPWGSAARCGIWDDELGFETCSHRFGQCTGDGSSCHPCLEQSDCPRGLCEESSFTGERFCIDLDTSCSCPEGTVVSCIDGGCPLTPDPGSQPMACYGGELLEPTPFFQKCVGASSSRSNEGEPEGCWPAF